MVNPLNSGPVLATTNLRETSPDILSSEDTLRLVRGRAVEWEALPVFGTRFVAPLALLWLEWWQLCLVLSLSIVVWYPLRSRFVSLPIAIRSAFLNNPLIAIPANVIMALAYFAGGGTSQAIVALLWFFISGILAQAYPPAKTPLIEAKLLEQMPRPGNVTTTAPVAVATTESKATVSVLTQTVVG